MTIIPTDKLNSGAIAQQQAPSLPEEQSSGMHHKNIQFSRLSYLFSKMNN